MEYNLHNIQNRAAFSQKLSPAAASILPTWIQHVTKPVYSDLKSSVTFAVIQNIIINSELASLRNFKENVEGQLASLNHYREHYQSAMQMKQFLDYCIDNFQTLENSSQCALIEKLYQKKQAFGLFLTWFSVNWLNFCKLFCKTVVKVTLNQSTQQCKQTRQFQPPNQPQSNDGITKWAIFQTILILQVIDASEEATYRIIYNTPVLIMDTMIANIAKARTNMRELTRNNFTLQSSLKIQRKNVEVLREKLVKCKETLKQKDMQRDRMEQTYTQNISELRDIINVNESQRELYACSFKQAKQELERTNRELHATRANLKEQKHESKRVDRENQRLRSENRQLQENLQNMTNLIEELKKGRKPGPEDIQSLISKFQTQSPATVRSAYQSRITSLGSKMQLQEIPSIGSQPDSICVDAEFPVPQPEEIPTECQCCFESHILCNYYSCGCKQYCKECHISHIKAKINDDQLPCCPCKALPWDYTDFSKIQSLLMRDHRPLLEKIDKILMRKNQTLQLIKCPNCPVVMSIQNQGVIVHCGKVVCRKCHMNHQTSEKCKTDTELILPSTTNPCVCPVCFEIIDVKNTLLYKIIVIQMQKAEGCEHMDCPNCKPVLPQGFCVLCSARRQIVKAHDNSYHRKDCKLWTAPPVQNYPSISAKCKTCKQKNAPCQPPNDSYGQFLRSKFAEKEAAIIQKKRDEVAKAQAARSKIQ